MSNDQLMIVGAGVAGLSAAKSFIQNGFPPTHLSIIEKNSNAGGKVSSIIYKGLAYELGASIIIPGVHQEIENLRDQFGLTTRSLGNGVASVDTEEINRYLKMYTDHSKSKKTWDDFIHTYHFEQINNSLQSIIAGAGYSNHQTNPTEASIIQKLVSPRLVKSLFLEHKSFELFNNGGWQELWIKMAEDLKKKGVQFYYESEVKKITRNSLGKMKIEGLSNKKEFSYQTDHVFYTADLFYLPDILTDAQDCEIKLYKDIVHNEIYSYVVEVDGLKNLDNVSTGIEVQPYLSGIKNTKGQMETVFGYPMTMVKPYKNSNVFNVYALGAPTVLEKDVSQNILNYFKEKKAVAKIVQFKKWNYFPRIKGDAEVGYKSLMKLQGLGGLWMAGEIFSFSAVHSTFENGKVFAEKMVKGSLGESDH